MQKLTLATLFIFSFLLLQPPSLPAQEPDASPTAAPASSTADIQSELALLRQQMADLRLRYAPVHPEVILLQARIDALTAALKDQDTLAQDQAAAKVTAEAQARAAKYSQEIADLQARQAGMQKNPPGANPSEDIIPIQDRITALQAAADWDKSHASTPRVGLFEFNGGHPVDLIRAASDRFHLGWPGIVTLPGNQDSIRIPQFSVYVNQPSDILNMYNWLAKSDPSMGRWDCKGDPENPDLLILTAPHIDPSNPQAPEMKVKAFSVADIYDKHWPALMAAINDADRDFHSYMANYNQGPEARSMQGACAGVDESTKIFVVIGTQSYIDMVGSVISAFEANPGMQKPKPF